MIVRSVRASTTRSSEADAEAEDAQDSGPDGGETKGDAMIDLRMCMALCVALAACQTEVREEPAADEAGNEALQPVDTALIVAIGDSAATALTTTLMGRVRAEVERAGPTGAVSFCSEQALPLTAGVEDALAPGLELKRTSDRIRNPDNAPDALEREALAQFAGAAMGDMPPWFVQGTDDGWRYYKPMVVAELCTTCHGPVEEIDPEVRRVLAERYPDDHATGYSVGDFRGLVRVSIPTSALQR